MIGLLFLLILAWQFYIGYVRGIVLQAYYLISGLFSLFIAGLSYQKVAEQITLWVPFANPNQETKVSFFTEVNLFDLDRVFYAGVAFAGVFACSYLVCRLIGIFLHVIDLDKFDTVQLNAVSGGLSVLFTLLCFSLVTSLMATLPINAIQEFLAGHLTTKLLIGFPIFSSIWKYFWVTRIF